MTINKENTIMPENNPEINEIKDSIEDTITDNIADDNDISDKQHKDSEATHTDKKKKNIFGKKKESEVDLLKKQIEEINVQKSEIHDRYLRLYSEFDNYRKRSQKEKLDTIKNASEDMIRNLLPVVDDFERAIKSMEKVEGGDALKEGVQLIFAKLQTILKQKGLSTIECIGEPFNTDFHEAITNIPAIDESQKGLIIDEIEKGYMLNEKMIRFAKVVVAN